MKGSFILKKNLFAVLCGISVLLLSGTALAASVDAGGSIASLLTSILPFVLIIGIFYFLMIRPQRKKEKETKAMLEAVKVGDRVTTIGGIFGRVTNIKDDVITVEIGSDRTKLVVARWAIRTVEGTSAEGDTLQA